MKSSAVTTTVSETDETSSAVTATVSETDVTHSAVATAVSETDVTSSDVTTTLSETDVASSTVTIAASLSHSTSAATTPVSAVVSPIPDVSPRSFVVSLDCRVRLAASNDIPTCSGVEWTNDRPACEVRTHKDTEA